MKREEHPVRAEDLGDDCLLRLTRGECGLLYWFIENHVAGEKDECKKILCSNLQDTLACFFPPEPERHVPLEIADDGTCSLADGPGRPR